MATDHARVQEPVSPVSAGPIRTNEETLYSAFQQAVAPLIKENRRALRILFYVALLGTDLLCIFFAFAAGSILHRGDLQGQSWLRISLAVAPLFILCAMHNGAYSLEALRSVVTGVKRAIAALVSSFAMLFVVSYFLKAGQDISRMTVGIGLVGATGADEPAVEAGGESRVIGF